MILKDALQSLSSSKARAFFYWFTFILTTCFIFLFFNLSMSDVVGVTFFNAEDGVALTVTVFVVVICMIEIFFANDFFIRDKAKELAVRLVCGATYVQVASYLLIQTIILLLLAVPAGLLLAVGLMPLINQVLNNMAGISFVIQIHSDAIITTAVVLVFVVFWIILLNLSFSYKNSAKTLMSEKQNAQAEKSGLFNFQKAMEVQDYYAFRPEVAPQHREAGEWYQKSKEKAIQLEEKKKAEKGGKKEKIIALIMYLGPMVLMYFNADLIIILSAVSLFGYIRTYQKVILPWLNEYIDRKKIDDGETVAYLGFFRSDMKMLRMNMILLLFTVILLLSLLFTAGIKEVEVSLVILSYVVMNVLLSLALVFKCSAELADRKKYYKTLSHLGFHKEQLEAIKCKEMLALYGYTLASGLIYIFNIFAALFKAGSLSGAFATLLTMIYVIPLVICGFVNFFFYKKNV